MLSSYIICSHNVLTSYRTDCVPLISKPVCKWVKSDVYSIAIQSILVRTSEMNSNSSPTSGICITVWVDGKSKRDPLCVAKLFQFNLDYEFKLFLGRFHTSFLSWKQDVDHKTMEVLILMFISYIRWFFVSGATGNLFLECFGIGDNRSILTTILLLTFVWFLPCYNEIGICRIYNLWQDDKENVLMTPILIDF